MKVQKSSGTGGAWLDKSAVKSGDELKLVTEAAEVESQHGTQLVAKCRLRGASGGATEPVNVAINTPSKNALIDAFGDDTINWTDQILTIATEKVVIGGRRLTSMYLIPVGYSLNEDDGGYLVITKEGGKSSTSEDTRTGPEITPEDIPF